jgi:hypothetical protein
MTSLEVQISDMQFLPILQSNGSNWFLYKNRVTSAIISKGLGRYLAGTIPEPPAAPVHPDGAILTNEEEEELEAALTKLDAYWAKESEAI